MKAFTAQIYDEVRISKGIYLTVRGWEKPDPFISLGWNERVYPPPLFSRIENNRLIEIEDSAAILLALREFKGPEFSDFSMAETGEKILVHWCIGNLSIFIFHPHKNLVLARGRYPTFSGGDIVTSSLYSHKTILAVLPANGGAIEASGYFFDKAHHKDFYKMILKTIQGEVKIELPY